MKVANCRFDVIVTVSKHTNKSERTTYALGSMKKEFVDLAAEERDTGG